ncbi:glutamine amidotransferase [soil metagenome]
MGTKVLLAGESWIMHTVHQKGFDDFTTTAYGEGHQWLSSSLRGAGFEVEHLPNHLANERFPGSAEELSQYEVVMLSDIGSNTLLLHPDTFVKSEKRPNRLDAIREYVWQGGGFVMVGGYLSSQGIEAKARYAGTAVETALPVTLLTGDDRVEVPQGESISVKLPDHPIVAGLDGQWPELLGYNKVMAKPDADLVALAGSDPLIVAGHYGSGRSVAFSSDCGPHWAPPEFVEWPGYARLWPQLVGWAAGG